MATIGTILIQAANQAGSITGPNAPSSLGVGSGGASDDLRAQKSRADYEKKSLEQGEKAPKFWTAAFKKMGIQMGLAGILKQSQIFTSTIGSLFQIFGAFVDVILAPFVPLFIPAMRWLARQLPGVAKTAQWTADKLAKGVSAVWGFLTGGKIWAKTTDFIKRIAGTIWDKIKDVLNAIKGFGKTIDAWTGGFFSTVLSKIDAWVLEPLKTAMQYLWEKTLGGWKYHMGGVLGGLLNFGFPTWGGGGSNGVTTLPSNIYDRNRADAGLELGGTPPTKPAPKPRPGLNLAGFDLGNIGGVQAAGMSVGGATALNLLTSEVKLGKSAKWRQSKLGGGVRNPNLDMPPGRKVVRTGVGGWVDTQEINPLRRIPFTGLVNKATSLPIKSANVAKNLMFGGAHDMAQVAQPNALNQFLQGDDLSRMNLGNPAKTPTKAAFFADDLGQVGNKPTKLSNAVNAFNEWVKKTGRGLGKAARGGASAFQGIFDEGLSLADDVVKLAKVTPGMGFVGGVVSVGFKKVIPGIAGLYMASETVADLWKMANSSAPWLGDWKSLNAWKDEGLGSLFAKGTGPGSVVGTGLLGIPTEGIGNIQSRFGLGTSISDWQNKITKNQQEGGVLSEGKLMDMIIRGTTGFGGAALSTFFPGLGSLAGGALYEGGRFATTGINVPGIEGTIGGNESKYGPAQDFSDLIIQAIKEGFGSGVPMMEIR